MSKRPSSTGIQRLGFEKTRSAASLSSAFQAFMKKLPTVIRALIRDFALHKGAVRWCSTDRKALTQSVHIYYLPQVPDERSHADLVNLPHSHSHDLLCCHTVTSFAVGDRVWVCQRSLRYRSMGTVALVFIPRKNPNPVEDAEEKKIEDEKFGYWKMEYGRYHRL